MAGQRCFFVVLRRCDRYFRSTPTGLSECLYHQMPTRDHLGESEAVNGICVSNQLAIEHICVAIPKIDHMIIPFTKYRSHQRPKAGSNRRLWRRMPTRLTKKQHVEHSYPRDRFGMLGWFYLLYTVQINLALPGLAGSFPDLGCVWVQSTHSHPKSGAFSRYIR
jgi:hypothetical protein